MNPAPVGRVAAAFDGPLLLELVEEARNACRMLQERNGHFGLRQFAGANQHGKHLPGEHRVPTFLESPRRVRPNHPPRLGDEHPQLFDQGARLGTGFGRHEIRHHTNNNN